MKAKWVLAACFVIVTSALAHAGGPPPMYVVVDKVVIEPEKRVSHWVQIWGTFTRTERSVDKAGKEVIEFSKPAYGYIYLSLPTDKSTELSKELEDWQKAAGTGKAVAVGSCGDGGSLLTCAIHQPKETVTKPDAAYTSGILKRFHDDLYANGMFNEQQEVKALLKAVKERK